jgi:hypothetical protein
MSSKSFSFSHCLLTATLAASIAGLAPSAHATLQLTAAGIAKGFSLSTFASGFQDSNNNGTGIGPTGVGFLPGGTTIVASYITSTVVAFPSDTDGQSVATNGTSYTGFYNPVGVVTMGGTVFVANQANRTGTVVSLTNTGAFGSTIATIQGAATGLAGNPSTGHLYVSNVRNEIYDVDPATGTYTTLLSGYGVDGVSLSPDRSTLFFESNSHIYGLQLSTKAVTDYGFVSGADGVAAASGAFAGNLFVNTNFGQLVEINAATLLQTVIATNGSRGDIMTVDPTNGTLLIAQSNEIVRLSGATFGVPEPTSVTAFALGVAVAGALRRRKRIV